MKTLRLKNYFFYAGGQNIALQIFLGGLMLHGKESRERTRFLKMIEGRTQEIEQERIKLGEKHCKKNKKGELIYLDRDNKETTDKLVGVQFLFEKVEDFTKELSGYLNEDYILDITPANSETISVVKKVLEETNKDFTGIQANEYFEWCEAFQNIKDE